LRLFGKIDDAFTFQLFPEKKDSKQFPRVLHGTLQDLYPRLAEENLRGSGIFITINQTVLDNTLIDIQHLFDTCIWCQV